MKCVMCHLPSLDEVCDACKLGIEDREREILQYRLKNPSPIPKDYHRHRRTVKMYPTSNKPRGDYE